MTRKHDHLTAIARRWASLRAPARIVCVAFAVAAAGGCSTVPNTRPAIAASITPQQWACLSEGTRRDRLLRVYEQFDGTKHRMGGTGGRGMDCSAFAREVYREAVGADLPRTTAAQAQVGVAVDRKNLAIGDLVLFKPRSYPRHVGVYIGDGRFIHVSSKRGVMTSVMNEGFWSKHYWTARRLREATACKH